MSTDHNSCDNYPLSAPPETIAQRVQRGRESDRAHDNAIVPFPDKFGVPNSCTGKVRGDYERMVAAGYHCTPYAYRGANGEIIQYVLRYDHAIHPATNPKAIKPILYYGKIMPIEDRVGFAMLAKPRPLYGLDRLAARPEAPVLVVEGEKTAEAAGKLFPDHVAITWMSGAPGARHTEMLALSGRSLAVWPDNDPAGRTAMRMFAAKAFEAGALSVKIVDVPAEFGAKWDLADAIPDAIGNDYDLQALLESARSLTALEVAHLTSNARERAEQRRLLGYQPGYSRVPVEHVQTALHLLDAGMYGNEWRRVARCLFYAFGDDGLSVFDEWSRESAEKYRKGEPARLWAAYAAEANFRGEPLAWLFRRGKEVLKNRSESGGEPNVDLDQNAFAQAAIEELSENHAVVVRSSRTAVLWENYDPRFKRYTETYLKKNDFTDNHVRKLLPFVEGEEEGTKKGRPKLASQGSLWFGSASRRAYDGIVFAPGESLEPKFLNSWRGFTVDPTNDPSGWSRLRDHLRYHVAGGDHASFEYLLNWMAFAVQHLNRPIKSALILIGKKGSGKSIVTQFLGHLFGQHAFVTPRMDDVTGRFNERLETTVLLGLEEAVAPANKAADSALKHLVTSPTLRLEGKFFGVWEAPNHLRIIVTSNHEHVVRADGSDRRYAVFDVVNPYQSDPMVRARYFGEMTEQMETGGYGSMLGQLLQRDVSRWNPEAIPETPALVRQKQLSLGHDPVQSYLFERLSDGTNITHGDSGSGVPIHSWSESEIVWVPARDLLADFRIYAAAHGMRFSERQLAMRLPQFMPEGFKSAARWYNEGDGSSRRQAKAYPFPPLEKARQRFEEITGLSIPRESPSPI